jgi:cell division protein FtsL
VSVPARSLPATDQRTGRPPPSIPDAGNGRPSTRLATPERPVARGRPRTAVRSRRPGHPVFLVFAALVVVSLVVGVVALNAMVAQVAFAVHTQQSTETDLAEQHEILTDQVAGASSPNRIARWASDQGMVVPDRVVVLRVPGAGRSVRG